MSIHALVLCNRSTVVLDKTIHALRAQTVVPDVITVVANVDHRVLTVNEVCAEERVALYAANIAGDTRRLFLFHSYPMLPNVLDKVTTNYVIVLRDTDMLHPRMLQTMVAQFQHDPRLVNVICNFYRTHDAKRVPDEEGNVQDSTTVTFSNTLLHVDSVKICLNRWKPTGYLGNDYDLIKLVGTRGNTRLLKDVLLESDPYHWKIMYGEVGYQEKADRAAERAEAARAARKD